MLLSISLNTIPKLPSRQSTILRLFGQTFTPPPPPQALRKHRPLFLMGSWVSIGSLLVRPSGLATPPFCLEKNKRKQTTCDPFLRQVTACDRDSIYSSSKIYSGLDLSGVRVCFDWTRGVSGVK